VIGMLASGTRGDDFKVEVTVATPQEWLLKATEACDVTAKGIVDLLGSLRKFAVNGGDLYVADTAEV
jgi:hypothetical protein